MGKYILILRQNKSYKTIANWGNQEFFSEVKAETEYVKKLLQQEVIN